MFNLLILTLVGMAPFLIDISVVNMVSSAVIKNENFLETAGNSDYLKEEVEYTLRGVKRESIFAPNFKYLVFGTENNTMLSVRHATPTEDELQEISNGHFINSEELYFHGEGKSRKIRSMDEEKSVKSGKNSTKKKFDKTKKLRVLNHLLSTVKSINEDKPPAKAKTQRKSGKAKSVGETGGTGATGDYIDLDQPVILGSSEGNVNVQPKVLVILDYSKYQEFDGSTKDILDYIGIFFHVVNQIWSGREDLKINFRVTGVATMSSGRADKPIWGELPKDSSWEGLDIRAMIVNLSKWIFSNKNILPIHDVAVYLTATNFFKVDATGATTSSIAYLKSACFVNEELKQSFALSVAADVGPSYDGAYTVAHLLAHNLGATHDGDPSATSCPAEEGFIMGLQNSPSENRILFSDCSVKMMKEYINSDSGSCLKENINNAEVPLSMRHFTSRKQNPLLTGHFNFHYSLHVCAVLTGKSNSFKLRKKTCAETICKFYEDDMANDKEFSITLSPKIMNGYPCGKNGESAKCKDGQCLLGNKVVEDNWNP